MEMCIRDRHKFESRRDKYEVVRCVREELGQKALEQEILERYDGIVLWDINTGLRNKLLKFCYRDVYKRQLQMRIFICLRLPVKILQPGGIF